MSGVNIEFHSPKITKHKNGYCKGWEKDRCLKPIFLNTKK
jgi:hypothetical protein